MLSIYPNLPGFRTDLRDYNLHVEPEVAATQKIVILGTATDGPVGTPVVINRPEEAEEIFGSAVDSLGRPNGATLLPKFYEAYYAGARNIALMRISGSPARNSIAGVPREETRKLDARDQLGIANGNDETVFAIPIDEGDELVGVRVVANGQELPSSAFTFDARSVTLLKDAADSNADVAIDYIYLHTEVATRSRGPLRPLGTSYTTYQSPDGEVNWDESTLQVWVNGTLVDNDATPTYTVDAVAGHVTFLEALEADDVVEASFKYTRQVQVDDFATGLVATGSPQELNLSHVPVFTTFKLFANGYEVPKDGYLLDTAAKKVTLLPGAATNKAVLSAAYQYEETSTIFPAILIASRNAGSLYNQVVVRVEDMTADDGTVYGKRLVIIKPESKKSSEFEPPMEFTSVDFPSFGELVEAVNSYTRNNVVELSTDHPGEPTANLVVTGTLHLSGGKDGLNLTKQEIYELLGGKKDEEGNLIQYGAYQLLENYDGDIYVPAGVYADDDLGSPAMNFADQLAQFCAVQTLRNNECRGVIAVRPPEKNDLPSVVARVEELIRDKAQGKFSYYLKNLRGEFMRDNEGRLIDIGRHIDLVALPTGRVANQVLGAYSTTFEALYAGLTSSLSSASDTTNKVLPGVLKLDYELSVPLHDKLSEAGFVTFWTEPARGVTVVNGVTAAGPDSDYRSLPNIRIALEAAKRIRAVSQKYRGEPYNLVKKTAHATDIQAELDSMVDPEGKLIDFSFTIHQSIRDRVLHNAVIILDLVPAFSLKNITMPVSLRPSL